MEPVTNSRSAPGEALSRDWPPPAATSGQSGIERERRAWASFIENNFDDGKYFTAEPDAADRWTAAVSRWLVDASLLVDAQNLHTGLETLRSAHVRLSSASTPESMRLEGMITALAETARACLDRARQTQLAETLDPRTVAARMLIMIDTKPGITSAEMTQQLDVDDSQISRSGRALIEHGLAVKERHGRVRSWRSTPRGAFTAQRTRNRAEKQPTSS